MIRCLLLHRAPITTSTNTYLIIAPLRFNVKKSSIRVPALPQSQSLKSHSTKQSLAGTTLKSFGWKKIWRHYYEQSPADRQP